MDKETLFGFIKSKGLKITGEVKEAAEELVQILDAQKKDMEDISVVLRWLEEKRKSYPVKTQEVGIKDLEGWSVDPDSGNIHHKSGKFFTIMGIRVSSAKGREVVSWTQPMIKQEECGILGMLCQKRNSVMQYLLYAKYEPGSIINIQLSPTLQATDSNLKKAHGGEKTRFAEYFENNTQTRLT